MLAKTKESQKESHDPEFLRWFSSSFWLVERQLHEARERTSKKSLQWVMLLPEFRDWHTNSNGSVLWIQGAPGVGKSTMAGYIIDYLTKTYSETIVAYFFCKSGQTGLTNACDIVRTLAYQAFQQYPQARPYFEGLKAADFPIDKGAQVSFLFEKLLRIPLEPSGRKLYIVLDGLDEGEYDATVSKEEMDVLIEHIASLPLAKLLLLSRPHRDIAGLPQNSKTKIITNENFADIQMFVEHEVKSSTNLLKHFGTIDIALEFFATNANGIFLWVSLSLSLLSRAQSRKQFEELLRETILKKSNRMDSIYSTILSQIKDSQEWINETLRWVVVAKRPLSVDEIREAVEFSLDDTHTDFRKFLTGPGGSLLRLVPNTEGDSDTVQLFHITLRSFITQSAPSSIRIEEKEAHMHVANNCLRYVGQGTSRTQVHLVRFL